MRTACVAHHYVLTGSAPAADGVCVVCGARRAFTGGDRTFAEASVSWRESRVFAIRHQEPTAVQGRRER